MPRTGRPPLPDGQRAAKTESERRYIARLQQEPEKYAAYLARRRAWRVARMADPVKRAARNARDKPRNLEAQRRRFRDVNRWPQAALVKLRSRCKKSGVPFNLTVEDLQIPDVCPALGIPFVLGAGNQWRGDANPSIDRLRPELGYVKGNVKIISWRANNLKNNCTQARELRLVAEYIVKYLGEHEI